MIQLPASYRRIPAQIVDLNLAGRPPALRYALAIAYVAVATVLRLVLPLDSAPYLVYMPGILVIAFVLGNGPGFVASCVSMMAAFCVLIVHNRVNVFNYGHLLGSSIFLAVTLVLVLVCDALRRSMQQRQADLLALKAANDAAAHADAQLRLLNHELGHRLKNTLAMVQAIANQTLRRAGSLAEAQAAFEARLIALGKAQDVLISQNWEKADLREVVCNALGPHTDVPERFNIAGPELRLSSRCGLALSLAIHELATNAAKYGALSVEPGRIDILWDVAGDDPAAVLTLRWIERGGPAVTKPEHTGFGSVMIERSLSGYFKGKAEIAYLPAGVQLTITAPVTYNEAIFQSGQAEIQACK